ncbi:antA/AntB antirepressor family protein [Bartonella schoenbuchensis]|uniref:Anti-repressor protein n=1 Tax=Bartonella schoenbuchensis m07a TaxID=1094496 RepID=N6VJ51_9HYPH|nr:antA/AntB antirepressor family protein [Bartonella schoenbuchensis]ENN91052.1 anti-repressor protein [Bartonella schoenbuchensis m07a]
MNTLITISEQTVGQETVQTVNARELHAFLEVGRDFTNWIKDRIKKYEFEEGKDYVLTLAKIGERQNVVLKEYHLTLSVAKELSMVENNKKGKQARQYFIECERKAKQPLDLVSALQNPLTIRQLLLPIDKITEAFIYANQVLKKHLHFTADRLPIQSFLCTLKALTHCMRVAYSDPVGCGYAIQYPHGESITTDCEPCFLTPGALF